MRLYSFTNMYLSSLQVGLQTGHCVADMFIKYHKSPSIAHKTLLDWAEDHKTMILLNAGYAAAIQELISFFDSIEHQYPHGYFMESKEALEGVTTCVSIVLPAKIYDTAFALRKARNKWEDVIIGVDTDGNNIVMVIDDCNSTWTLSPWECELIERLNTFNLAK